MKKTNVLTQICRNSTVLTNLHIPRCKPTYAQITKKNIKRATGTNINDWT